MVKSSPILSFHKHSIRYAIVALFLLLVEIAIALFVKDKIIRPYIGDLLVVMLIYSFVKIVIPGSIIQVAAGTLIFAFLVEIMQYIGLVEILHLEDNNFARTVIGSKFNVLDLVMYTIGILLVLVFEKKLFRS